VFNATFNNISVRAWWSVLLLEETGVPGKNHRPAEFVTINLTPPRDIEVSVLSQDSE
jgi:hypothetical protein